MNVYEFLIHREILVSMAGCATPCGTISPAPAPPAQQGGTVKRFGGASCHLAPQTQSAGCWTKDMNVSKDQIIQSLGAFQVLSKVSWVFD